MKSRLALVAFREAGEGPWIRSRGNETGIRVQYLGQGERIMAVIVAGDSSESRQVLDREGTFALPADWSKIKFIKHCEGVGSRNTQVDLLVA